MAGAMLVLLAACRVRALRRLIGAEVLSAGGHLRRLFLEWQKISGKLASPSVEQSVRIIEQAEEFIGEVYTATLP